MVDHPDLLPTAHGQLPIPSSRNGYVACMDAEAIGNTAMVLGAGRERLDSDIDPAVGVMLEKKRGDRVARGEILAVIHYNSDQHLKDASKMIREAYTIVSRKPGYRPLIQNIVTSRQAKRVRS